MNDESPPSQALNDAGVGSEEFFERVRVRARLFSLSDAELATAVTLSLLGDRLIGDGAEELAARLPPTVAGYLRRDRPGRALADFDATGMVDLAAEEIGVDREHCSEQVEAVLFTVAEVAGQYRLPADIEDLISGHREPRP